MVMWLVLGASWIFSVIKTNSDTSFCLGAFERPDYNTTLSREKNIAIYLPSGGGADFYWNCP